MIYLHLFISLLNAQVEIPKLSHLKYIFLLVRSLMFLLTLLNISPTHPNLQQTSSQRRTPPAHHSNMSPQTKLSPNTDYHTSARSPPQSGHQSNTQTQQWYSK